ncbi:hypothetical protein GCM10010124_33330 [Pilimelia terevasa]|uniref:DUF1023 domain-containing protein n=1 Tax=Pilimelia terevasa TaxID=53372 RepID=A0A8J3FJ81_9ACTN|nr:alpha/beta hydrolase [Pilimelia terevasa]GGK37861.1 hypothetical protein GCM10010124_33330 [Pilimelia terevasa]
MAWARGRTTISSAAAALLLSPGGWLFGPTTPPRAAAPAGLAAWQQDRAAPPAPLRATPATWARYFRARGARESGRLADAYPAVVGNLDGAPAALRYRANARRSGRPAPRQVLAFDPRGDGRVVEVFGDLRRARRVAVLVPGVGTTLANFDGGRVPRRAPAVQAQVLREALGRVRPAAETAVIAWLGYDPPEAVDRGALREDRAAAGARSLTRFVAGLAAQRRGQTYTLVGHSYGSTVLGLAAPHLPASVTDVVVLASPGLGGARRVADLRTPARVWAATADRDWIRRVPGVRVGGLGHGPQPHTPGFGARRLPTSGVTGHDGYLVPGTDLVAALAAVVAAPPGR